MPHDELDDSIPEYIDLDADAFEDDWRAWLENPPVDWSPPRGATKILTNTLDMREEGNFVIRFDAWQGEAGIHIHARVVMLTMAPATVVQMGYVKQRKPWWAFWKKPEYHLEHEEHQIVDYKVVSKNIVGSFVVPWGIWSAMETDRLDPTFPKKPNGKGGDPDPDMPWRAKDVDV